MEKKNYIQPTVVTAVWPSDALMDSIPLAGSPTGPSLGAPQRRLLEEPY